MNAGWSAIAVAILTVTGLITLLVYFETGSVAIGALNELNTVAMALATVPVAFALRPVAARRSRALATVAVAGNLAGVALAASFSLVLAARVLPFEVALPYISGGNGLIGAWLVVTAVLVAAAGAVPPALGWFGIAGGGGLALTALAFPVLGQDHPLITAAGLVALIGLVGFFTWTGALMIRRRLVLLPSGARPGPPA
jgi:hypothetical protein